MLKRQTLPDRQTTEHMVWHPVFLRDLLAPILAISLLALSVFPVPLYAFTEPDIHLLRSDATGVTFEYVPAPLHRDTVSLGGEQFDVLTIDRCISTTAPGRPLLPQRHVLIGVPPDAAPSVTVLDAPYRNDTGYRLAPAPLIGTDGIGRHRLDEAAYTSAGFAPEGRITAGTIGIVRGLRIMPITLAPIAYSAATGRARIYERIRVDVRFNTPQKSEIPTPRPDNNRLASMYEAMVLNAQAAVRWRQPMAPARPLRRVHAFGPGEWFKVTLNETGFYQLDRQTLQDAGLNVSGLDPRTIRMFNGDGRTLPQDVDAPRPDLNEIPIRVVGEEDGRFDDDDVILFYGTALHGWEFQQALQTFTFFHNPYTDTNVHWLTAGGTTLGRRIQSRDGRTPGGVAQGDSPSRIHEERELLNPSESGTDWFWQLFDGAFREEATFQVPLNNVTRNGQVTARFRFHSKTRFTHRVQVFINNQFVGERLWNGESVPIVITATGPWLQNGTNEVRIVVPRVNQSSNQPDHVYFDWFELFYWTALDAAEGDIEFEQDPQISAATVRYQVTGAKANAQTFDVTDLSQVTQIVTDAGGAFQDSVRATDPARYRVITPEHWKNPVAVVRDVPSNLRDVNNGADYIIITHDDFADAVEALRLHRETHAGLRVIVARISDVYDEFAWGLFDPTAIRDFLRYATRNWSSGAPPAFAVLVGDGNYDYKNHSRSSPGSWIPPFERGERCTDDWYVYFDGNGDPLIENDIFPDMALGRLPVQTPEQADIVVQKIIAYEKTPEFGVWRNTIVLTADDERTPGTLFEEPFHIRDTERLYQNTIPRSFRVEKIYMTEFSLDAAGEKPDARDVLIDRINDGALLVNWVGHGAANLWAHERIFNTSRDLPSIANESRLPIFVTATCTAGRFDLVNEEAMAEEFLRVEGKGAVGFIGATRLSFPSPNAALNRFLYEGILTQHLPIGSALMQAKIRTFNRENSEKYVLFGDPAMQLGVPEQSIRFTADSTDTLRVLHNAVVSGEVVKDNTVDQTFNSTAFVRTSDSVQEVVFVTPRGGQIGYKLPGADVFRGPVTVEQGLFSASFIVPRDITYGGNLGRVEVYTTNGQTDASGTIDFLPLRGADPAFQDSLGPEIEVLVDGRPIVDGDFASSTATLTVSLSDESGINITGEVGHQITIQTDKDPRTRQDVTDLFVYDIGSFQQGSLQYQMPELTPGDHQVTIKTWDNFNNSSTSTHILSVVENMDLRVTDVMNYPNPFAGATTFTFELTQDADVTIQVYTVAGTLIRSFDSIIGFRGFNQVDWDGADRDGDRLANGAYLYKVTARTLMPEQKTVSIFGRILVVR